MGFAFPANAVPIDFTASGADATAIQATVDAFRTALGSPDNGDTPGSQPSGRREINWDTGAASPTALPTPMTTFSARGVVATTPGTGFEISGTSPPEFGDINASYPGIFATFSAAQLFAPLGSNVLDVLFTVPGTTNVQALTNGFGAVFTDVDLAGTTSIEFFDALGQSVKTLIVPAFDEGLSFAGVYFGDTLISRVRITLGNAALGPNDGDGVDVVALDNFIYGEPGLAVPEPASLTLFGVGLAGLAGLARRRPLSRPTGPDGAT